MELAQIRLLEEIFEIPVSNARLSFAHSIGEVPALVVGGG
jgi:[acyl-carrier-protein] S-malonyltransferase